MKKISMLLSLALIASMALVSCNSDTDNSYIIRQEYLSESCFNVVTDPSTGTKDVKTGVSYYFDFNYTDVTAEVSIRNLKIGSTTYPALVLQGLSWKMDEKGWKNITASNVTAVSTGSGSAPVFSTFRLSVLDRVVNQEYSPVVMVSYTVDGYSVTTFPRSMSYFGKTNTATGPSAAPYETKDTWYTIKINPEDMTCALAVNQAKFAQAMPSLNMEFPGLDFEFQGTNISVSKDALTPTIGGTPMSAFPISELSGMFNIAGDMNLRFNCETKGVLYTVNSSCSVLPSTDK